VDTTLDDIAQVLDVPRLQPEEMRLLLDATRDVAHRSERRYAPLAAFLLGAAMGRGERLDELASAVNRVLAVLPPEDPPAG
jgi:hypothetical protein